jgi:hypothetical protein
MNPKRRQLHSAQHYYTRVWETHHCVEVDKKAIVEKLSTRLLPTVQNMVLTKKFQVKLDVMGYHHSKTAKN